jgi:hypothetical protein
MPASLANSTKPENCLFSQWIALLTESCECTSLTIVRLKYIKPMAIVTASALVSQGLIPNPIISYFGIFSIHQEYLP